jgi:RPA family protein
MSLATRVIVAGTVQDISHAQGVVARTGEAWERHKVVVFGQAGSGVVAEIGFQGADKAVALSLQLGDSISVLAEVSVFRDDDSLKFVRVLPPVEFSPKKN